MSYLIVSFPDLCTLTYFGVYIEEDSNNFSARFNYEKIRYNIKVLQPTACLVVNPVTVGNISFLVNCTHPWVGLGVSMMVLT